MGDQDRQDGGGAEGVEAEHAGLMHVARLLVRNEQRNG
jgi:hypothetical protein